MLLLGLTSGGNVAATATGAHNGHGGHGLSGWSLELEAPREAHASSIGCESGPFGGAEQPCDFGTSLPLSQPLFYVCYFPPEQGLVAHNNGVFIGRQFRGSRGRA